MSRRSLGRARMSTVVATGVFVVAWGLALLSWMPVSRAQTSASSTLHCKGLSGPGSGVSASGTHLISLPYINPIRTAEDLCRSIPNAGLVRKYDQLFMFHDWQCGPSVCVNQEPGSVAACGSSCFCVYPGESYFVQVSASSIFQALGRHDPSFAIILDAPPTANHNFVSLPLTSFAANAQDIIDEIGGPVVNNVQRYNTLIDTIEVYTECCGGLNFPVVPGDGPYRRDATRTERVLGPLLVRPPASR